MSDDSFEDGSYFNFESWAKQFKIAKKARNKLQKMAYSTVDSLLSLTTKDLRKLQLTPVQLKAVQDGITSLQQTTAAKDSSPTRDHLATLLGKSRYGLRCDDEGDDTAAKLSLDTGLQCAATFDPRAILIVKTRTAKAVHITEFLTDDVKRRRSPRNNYRIQNATTADGSCIITHDQDKSYAGLTSEEWGAANCRLMNFLLSPGRLARHDVEYYLACTTKIFDFASKYTWASILTFDQQYREVQAEYILQWGIFAPQLEMQLLQLKPTALPQLRRQPTHVQEECKLFKLHRCLMAASADIVMCQQPRTKLNL